MLAITIRRDVEVVTDVYRQTAARMAEAMGIPPLDPKVDDPLRCLLRRGPLTQRLK